MNRILTTAIGSAAVAVSFLALSTTAQADIRVLFREGAPKDSFELRNTGGCALGPMELIVDLNGSAGSLIFDTQAQGPGVEVYQPFELDTLTESPLGQTRVAGSEIKGAKITARFDGTAALKPEVTARFDRDAVAVLPVSSCLS